MTSMPTSPFFRIGYNQSPSQSGEHSVPTVRPTMNKQAIDDAIAGVMPKNLERILKDINAKLESNGILKDRHTLDIWTTLMSYLLQGEYALALPKRQDLQRHMQKSPMSKVNTFNSIIQRLDEILDVYIPPPDLGTVNVVDAYWDGRIKEDDEEKQKQPANKATKSVNKSTTKSINTDWDTPRKPSDDPSKVEFAPEIVESSVFEIKSPERQSRADDGVSREEFFLLKANESVLMKTVEDQQSKIKNLQQNVEHLERKNVLLQDEIKALAGDQEEKLSVCVKAEREIKFLRKELADKEHSLELSLMERNTLLDRLSTVADVRLEYEPPRKDEIDDLNRPSQLTDKYCRLHDNEWGHALQVLKVEFSESDRNAIKMLLEILHAHLFFDSVVEKLLYFKLVKDSYSFCLDVTESHTRSLTDELLEPIRMSHDTSKKEEKPKLKPATRRLLGDLKRSVGRHAVTALQQEFIASVRQRKPGAYTDVKLMTLRPYILKCVELCWFMVLQTPPISIDDGSLVRAGEEFDRDSYRYYTISGSTMDYVVWPALFASRNGLILTRGVAQPKPEGVALRISSRSSTRDT